MIILFVFFASDQIYSFFLKIKKRIKKYAFRNIEIKSNIYILEQFYYLIIIKTFFYQKFFVFVHF